MPILAGINQMSHIYTHFLYKYTIEMTHQTQPSFLDPAKSAILSCYAAWAIEKIRNVSHNNSIRTTEYNVAATRSSRIVNLAQGKIRSREGYLPYV